MKSMIVVCIALLVCAFNPVQAKEAVADSGIKVETKGAFEVAAAGVRTEMEPDGRYGYVKPDERSKVETALAEMQKLFDKYGAVASMDNGTQIKLFNQQEIVNSILTRRDRDRVICERGPLTGTHLKVTKCRTYGEIEAIRTASRKNIDDIKPSPCGSKCK